MSDPWPGRQTVFVRGLADDFLEHPGEVGRILESELVCDF